MTTKKPAKPPKVITPPAPTPNERAKVLDVGEDVRHIVVDKGAIISDRINGVDQPTACLCCGNPKSGGVACVVCGN